MPSSRAENINCKSALADRELVSDDQVKLFCEVLHFRREYGERYDTADGRQIYTNRLRPLIPKLKFPLSNTPGLMRKIILPKQSEYTNLCDMHKGLNADFVHQWFKFVALEAGARLEPLRAYDPKNLGENISETVVRPLTRLHKMWFSSEQMSEAFGGYPLGTTARIESPIPVERQHDGCEACMLARIGSHTPTILALRAAVKSRISAESAVRHPSRLRLLRLIEPWLQISQARVDPRSINKHAWLEGMEQNSRLAREMYIKRKKIDLFADHMKLLDDEFDEMMSNLHHKGRKSGKSKSGDDNDDDNVLYQAENDIIDSYAALRATQRQSQSLRSNEYVLKTASILGENNPYKSNVDPAYHESRYSIDTVSNNRRVISGSSVLSADREHIERPRTGRPLRTTGTWDDVIKSGQQANPFFQSSHPLAAIPERPISEISRSRSVHQSTRTKSMTGNDIRVQDARHMQETVHRQSDRESIVSNMSRMSLGRPLGSRVSSMSSYADLDNLEGQYQSNSREREYPYFRTELERRGNQRDNLQRSQSRRDAPARYSVTSESVYSDASFPPSVLMSSRLSRPFTQILRYDDKQRLSQHGQRK